MEGLLIILTWAILRLVIPVTIVLTAGEWVRRHPANMRPA